MEKKYKLTIPEPCTENWDKMTPNENGRFCLSCSKTVVDFTAMLSDEVQHFFIQNQNKNICGRFKNDQLESLIIQIPSQVLYTQTNYHKIFLLALFITMGTTLFSCQDKNGTKQKIDKVEVVDNDTLVQHITVGETTSKNNKSDRAFLPPPPPPPKVDHVKFVKGKTQIKSTKNIKLKTNNCGETIKQKTSVEDVVYNGGVAIEIDPEYNGGIEKFYNYFKKDFKLPAEARNKTGEIQVSLVIGKDGSLEEIKPIKDLGFGITEEVIRVLKSSKKWQPGEQNGKKTRTRYLLSMQIQKDTLNTKGEKNISPIIAINVAKY